MKKITPPLSQSIITHKLEELDFDFRAETQNIKTVDDFDRLILSPYKQEKQIFYRGEKRNSITRPLLPTLYRKKEALFSNSKRVDLIDSEALYNFYKNNCGYFELFENIIEPVKKEEMYNFLSFSQHYFGISPLIDFTKSPYVALSFALKDRACFDEDVLIYTLELKSGDDYTNSIETANKWINDYSVLIFSNIAKHEFESPAEAIAGYKLVSEKFRGSSFLDMNAPTAKLIDVPSNDLIKYQQGVFLLLDDFSLFGKAYLTKKIRDEFNLKKWIIDKEICPALLQRLKKECPYYAYKNITDLSQVAAEIKRVNPLYR